jgi:hypothetical protein
MTTQTYNGWKNYETWNVALWLNGEEELYRAVTSLVTSDPKLTYGKLIRKLGLEGQQTPDGVEWLSDSLEISELEEMLEIRRSAKTPINRRS